MIKRKKRNYKRIIVFIAACIIITALIYIVLRDVNAFNGFGGGSGGGSGASGSW